MKRSVASALSSSGSSEIARRRWSSSSNSGSTSAASSKLIFSTPGVRVSFLISLYIPFKQARAKYARG
jgi:hypothetical protein